MPGELFKHSGMDNRIFPKIPAGSVVNLSGMGKASIYDIGAGTRFNISGMGIVAIGDIGPDIYFDISGMGKVYINGHVDPTVRFKISGMAKTIFEHRPPQSVIDNIDFRGTGTIKMPGGFPRNKQVNGGGSNVRISGKIGASFSFSASNGIVKTTQNGISHSYRGNSYDNRNGRISIDGIEVTANDPRLVSDAAASQERVKPVLPIQGSPIPITDKQRNAASLYWSKILTGEIQMNLLKASKGYPSFLANSDAARRDIYRKELSEQNPMWSLNFMNVLDSLLMGAKTDLSLGIEYHPEGLLKEAAKMANIPEALFPMGKLSMTFDMKGNIIVDNREEINAESYLSGFNEGMAARI